MGRRSSQTTVVTSATVKPNPMVWIVFVVLCAMILWSCRAFLDYGDLFAQLNGKPMIERGRIGSDEWRNFLARAGRINTQKTVAEARRLGVLEQQRSAVADGWTWVVSTESQLPSDAKVFLNVSSSLFYYYTGTFWYPRRVDVSTKPVLIRDDQTLAENAERMDASQLERLRSLGYTHIVTVTRQGIQLIDLRGASGGVKP